MQNVVAINAAARQGIIAAQATSDEMLLQSIADGGRTAMHILYSRHNVRVYRFILRIVRDTTMAEDLVSQVFLDVWRTAAQFEGRSQVSTWLLSIARFKALTALRQRRHEDIDQEDVLEIADQADTPEASLDRSTTSAILRACVAKLSPAHREIINLVYYHEKSVEEAGAIIGIPQSTVKTRMFYAANSLQTCLRVPASTASRHKIELFQLVDRTSGAKNGHCERRKRLPPTKQLKQSTTSPGKTQPLYLQSPTQR
jgi:RNA polymerase sigma-70 factor (ECF subfamily)